MKHRPAVSAIEAVKDSPWQLRRVYSTIPGHKISETLNLKTSKNGYFTLSGGITGFSRQYFGASVSINADDPEGIKPFLKKGGKIKVISKEEVSNYFSAEEWWFERFGRSPLWSDDQKEE